MNLAAAAKSASRFTRPRFGPTRSTHTLRHGLSIVPLALHAAKIEEKKNSAKGRKAINNG